MLLQFFFTKPAVVIALSKAPKCSSRVPLVNCTSSRFELELQTLPSSTGSFMPVQGDVISVAFLQVGAYVSFFPHARSAMPRTNTAFARVPYLMSLPPLPLEAPVAPL